MNRQLTSEKYRSTMLVTFRTLFRSKSLVFWLTVVTGTLIESIKSDCKYDDLNGPYCIQSKSWEPSILWLFFIQEIVFNIGYFTLNFINCIFHSLHGNLFNRTRFWNNLEIIQSWVGGRPMFILNIIYFCPHQNSSNFGTSGKFLERGI